MVEKEEVSELEKIPFITPLLKEKLMQTGYNDLKYISLATPTELTNATAISPALAKRLIEYSRSEGLNQDFTSCDELLSKEKQSIKLSTGSKSFDKLLGGGIEIGALTEAFGEFSTGKSQLGYQLAVNNFLTDENAITLVLDTELRFKASRIEEIAKNRGLSSNKVKKILNSVKKVEVMDSADLFRWTERIRDVLSKNNVKLVIIDSLMAHFRAEYIGRQELPARQQQIAKLLHMLNKMAKTYNFAVYMTNHVTTKPDQFFGDPLIHTGGNVVGHFSEYRIYLRKGKKGSRIAKLVDSSNLSEGEAPFIITSKGIEDSI